MKIKLFLFLIMAFASKESETEDGKTYGEFEDINEERPIIVKIEEDEYVKANKRTSEYIGVTYKKNRSKWGAQRWSKSENKIVKNGTYDDEEAAACASDTLARKLMKNGEQGHRFNFPGSDAEVHEKRFSSEYIGVTYNKNTSKWRAQRYSKNENKLFYNGSYYNEEQTAHASDTLARKLMENGEQSHKLNFRDDDTEIHKRKFSSKYIGVNYNKKRSKWRAQRWSKNENKMFHSVGSYKDEETAAHASDILAKQLIENGEKGHKINFPDDNIEEQQKKKSKEKEKIRDFGKSSRQLNI